MPQSSGARPLQSIKQPGARPLESVKHFGAHPLQSIKQLGVHPRQPVKQLGAALFNLSSTLAHTLSNLSNNLGHPLQSVKQFGARAPSTSQTICPELIVNRRIAKPATSSEDTCTTATLAFKSSDSRAPGAVGDTLP
jgi:hypothetical protein